MGKIFTTFMIAFSVLFSFVAFAQETLPIPIPEVSNADFFEALLVAIGGAKGASTLVIVSMVLQLLFKLLGTPLFASVWLKVEAQAKFLIVAVLSLGSLTTAQMIAADVTLGTALLHSTVITALMNYMYRYYELFVETKE